MGDAPADQGAASPAKSEGSKGDAEEKGSASPPNPPPDPSEGSGFSPAKTEDQLGATERSLSSIKGAVELRTYLSIGSLVCGILLSFCFTLVCALYFMCPPEIVVPVGVSGDLYLVVLFTSKGAIVLAVFAFSTALVRGGERMSRFPEHEIKIYTQEVRRSRSTFGQLLDAILGKFFPGSGS